MIGDMILKFLIFFKQLFCIHDYIPDRIGIITGLYNGRVCSKCDKYEE
jgi:hypothetical protein